MSSKDEKFGVTAMSIFKRYILTSFLPALGQELRMRVKRRIKALHNAEKLFDKRSLIQQIRRPKELFDEAQAQILSFMHSTHMLISLNQNMVANTWCSDLRIGEHTPGWVAFQAIVRRKLQQKNL